MNDNFVISRIKVKSPKLAAIAQIGSHEAAVDEVYLTFLSRLPSAAEKTAGVAALVRGGVNGRASAIEDLAWACINKVEFLYSY